MALAVAQIAWPKVASCRTQKLPFDSRGAANEWARTSRKFGGALHAYRCPFCPAWHLTSQEQRQPHTRT